MLMEYPLKKKDLFFLLWSFIGLWVPFLLIFYTFFLDKKRTVLTYLFFMLLLGVLNFLFKKRAHFCYFLLTSSVVFSIFTYLDLAHFTIFKNSITASTLYILQETNGNESKEFMTMYLSPKLLIMGITHVLAIVFGLIVASKRYTSIIALRKFIFENTYSIIAVCLFCFIPLIAFKMNFLPFTVVKSVIDFRTERNKLSQLAIQKKGNFDKVIHKQSDEKEVYVLVVGESTTRTHMGLYDYYRQTNPLLTKRKEDLLIYKNVRSPHTHTIASLEKALTLGDYDKPKKQFNSTIVQLFNSAEFDTYFISNQNPIGLYETTATLISKTSSKSIFTNSAWSVHDDAIFEPLQKVLKEKSTKKFIMIHLMGTHLYYSNRYPKSYAFFNDKPKTKFNHELAHQTINTYDNAVLYNDYIIDKIINEIETSNSKSYVLYFSDHGEDVYETIDNALHDETIGTAPMYDIPFILWRSDLHKKEQTNWILDTDRAYNIEDLIHTVADLSFIQFPRFNGHKSIINSQYKKKDEHKE